MDYVDNAPDSWNRVPQEKLDHLNNVKMPALYALIVTFATIVAIIVISFI